MYSLRSLILVAVAYWVPLASADDRPFLLNLNNYFPLIGYDLEGGYLEDHSSLQLANGTMVSIRDVTGLGVLQFEPATLLSTLRDWTGRELASFPVASQQVNDLRVSPKGDRVAFAGDASWLRKSCKAGVFLATKTHEENWNVSWCAPAVGSAPTSVTWSRDGGELAFASGGMVYLLKTAGGDATPLRKGETARWSPVADRIAILDGTKIVVVDPKSVGKEVETHSLPIHNLVPPGLEWSADGRFMSVVHKTDFQPGDSRVQTALGIVDTRTWAYHETFAPLWGVHPMLRFVDRPISDLAGVKAAAAAAK